jgi:hypothetical protein
MPHAETVSSNQSGSHKASEGEMARKIFLVGLAITVIGLGTMLAPQLAAGDTGASNIIADEATRQMILQATVKISIYAPAVGEDGQPRVSIVDGQKQGEYVAGNGLGTVVRSGEQVLIVTHDHWKLLDHPEATVELSNVKGELLLTTSGQLLRNSIRYRDGATLVFSAPTEVADRFRATATGLSRIVKRGDILFIAYRHTDNGDAISVEPVIVKKVKSFEGHAAFQLESGNGRSVLVGNSGGGVWHNGELVANMWASVLMSGSSGVRETNISRAAQLPVGL